MPHIHPCSLKHMGNLLRLEETHSLDVLPSRGGLNALAYVASVSRDRTGHPNLLSRKIDCLLGYQLAPHRGGIQKIDNEPATGTHRGDHLVQCGRMLGILLEVAEAGEEIDGEVHR